MPNNYKIIKNLYNQKDFTISASTFAVLLANKESVNSAINSEKQTILHFASKYWNTPFISALLEMGADPLIKDNYGLAPIHYAALFNQTATLAFLIDRNPLTKDYPSDNGDTPLHFAVISGSDESVKLLIDKEVDLNIENDQKFTPLHIAALTNQLSMIESLFKHGVNIVNHANNYNYSALHITASTGNIDNSRALINYQANINLKEQQLQWTPLDFAKLARNTEMVEFLKKNKATDFGTVLKAKEVSNFIEMLKAVACNLGNKGLSIAAEFVPVVAQLALEDNNVNYWLRVGGMTAGNVGKNILEWSNNALMESSFCKEKPINVPKTNEVISLINAEVYLKHNNDDYLALEQCKSEDKLLNQFDELGSS